MPSPEKTSFAVIVAAGRELLESEGPQGLTMQKVATRVGVRAPSLYKHVANRAALLDAVAEATVEDLTDRITATDGTLPAIARCYRAFSTAHPEAFRLVMHSTHAPRPALARAAQPLIDATAVLTGPEESLEAARFVTAWLTGFISMELSGSFRLGGDVDRAFAYGLEALYEGLAR
ncbi:TetR/AcrR family transcriptional regulator [Streptomyces sp. SID11385]|uniref:TetR/AcrR family transcriptional regulator n=1 Tax=Streptomyces sp. SID11385 TaxID=2706031 RepID=UPI0013C9BF39|nr:TetR/AcrR family transcriptional regulator [Streptomyces sp. SID11385]NEA42831.1 TetR family transcriptional regulator [Streptomyces sp. SID11385]